MDVLQIFQSFMNNRSKAARLKYVINSNTDSNLLLTSGRSEQKIHFGSQFRVLDELET